MPWGGSALFKDRTDAGRQLAEALDELMLRDPVVLALPRGGVPLGLEIARRLRAPLDLLLVRKIGAPGNSEYGIGAVIDGQPPQRVLDEEAVRYAHASEAYIEAETHRQIEIIAARRALYMSGRKSAEVRKRSVIVADDGIATGSTVRAALKGLRGMEVASVTLAVPVAPIEVTEKLRTEFDHFVCLKMPRDFRSVGEYYLDFRQLTDDEVIASLAESAQPERGTPSSPLRSS
jgi:putative phosphoribosyl transferase